MLHGSIQEPWNFMAIKRMRKQWIPGSLSSPPTSLGTRLELMVPFEMGFIDVAERKEASYEDLIHRAKQAGYDSHLISQLR